MKVQKENAVENLRNKIDLSLKESGEKKELRIDFLKFIQSEGNPIDTKIEKYLQTAEVADMDKFENDLTDEQLNYYKKRKMSKSTIAQQVFGANRTEVQPSSSVILLGFCVIIGQHLPKDELAQNR